MKRVKRVGHSTSVLSDAFVGEERELSVDLSNMEVRVHDGATAGGFPALRTDAANIRDAAAFRAAIGLAASTLAAQAKSAVDITGGTVAGVSITGVANADALLLSLLGGINPAALDFIRRNAGDTAFEAVGPAVIREAILPTMAALSYLRRNAADDNLEERTPAQVLDDITAAATALYFIRRNAAGTAAEFLSPTAVLEAIMPNMAALDYLRRNAADNGFETRTPAQVFEDISPAANALDFLRRNAGDTAWESISPTTVLAAIGAKSAFSGCLVTRGSDLSIAHNTWTRPTWDSESYDVGGWHAASADGFTPPAGVEYVRLTGGAVWASNTNGNRALRFTANGAEITGCSRAIINTNGTPFGELAIASAVLPVAGQTLRLEVMQTSGGALNLTAGVATFFGVEKVN